MMKILNNRWVLLAAGTLIGACIGADLALRYAASQKFKYDQMLEDHFVESRTWDLATTMMTLQKVGNGDLEIVISNNQMLLRGAFLTLVDIHKSGDYPRKNDEMVKSLIRTKRFMEERPEEFLEMKLVELSAESLQNTENDDSVSNQETNPPRKYLKEAFDYVDSLETNGEQSAGENASRPTP